MTALERPRRPYRAATHPDPYDPWQVSPECGEYAHELCEHPCDCDCHLDHDLLRDLGLA